MSRRNESKKRIRWDEVFFILGLIFFIAWVALAYYEDVQEKHSQEVVVELRNMRGIEYAVKLKEEVPKEEENSLYKSYQDIFDLNEDMVGWLHIPETQIDYPVMQTMDDEEYYIDRNFYKEKDKNGCLILDTDSDLTKTSNNLIIHGHNMRSGAMFGSLDEYENQAYEITHDKLFFCTKDETRTYQIMAVIRSKVYKVNEDVFKYYKFFEATNQEEFDYFYDNIKQMSIFDTGVTAEFGDEFITLSTCGYHTKEGRIAVIAKRIS